MAHASPIDIREIEKTGAIDEERFYRLLSAENNYVDPRTVKNFYLGLCRLIDNDLKTQGVCRLPLIGDIALVKQKPHKGLSGGIQSILTGKYVLTMYFKRSWKDIFSKLAERGDRLDPREKLLGRTL